MKFLQSPSTILVAIMAFAAPGLASFAASPAERKDSVLPRAANVEAAASVEDWTCIVLLHGKKEYKDSGVPFRFRVDDGGSQCSMPSLFSRVVQEA